MSSRKDFGFKMFSIRFRRKVPQGMFRAPLWVLTKLGLHKTVAIYNVSSKRSWRRIKMGHRYLREIGEY